MILTCTSKGNTLPNGLSLGSASPLYFMLAKQSMNVDSPLWSVLLIQIHGPIAYSCQDLFSMDEKSVPKGGTAYSVLSATWSPRDSSPPINSRHSFRTAQPSCSATMVQTLEKLVLTTVPLVVLLDLWKAVWHLPLKRICLSTLFKRSCTTELTNLSRTLPWDDPVARPLDYEMHRREMAGKSCLFFGWQGWGPFLPSYLFFLGL